ncbi:MAG TPA: carboxypeptidase-like regulatory domain-containing protein [Puia sp.]|nr:carboxypeptidase-like regulatory domain-containing protein [Puia sp.]
MKVICLIVLQLLFCEQVLFSQKINISGKIVDEISKQELPKATIKINNQIFLADNKGLFSIWIERDLMEKYGLSVSYVGYESKTIKIADPDIFLMIKLNAVDNKLAPVVVSTGARNIIERAIDSIPTNYPSGRSNILGFQQTLESINDVDFFSRNDAYIKLFVPPYEDGLNYIQTQILQNRSFVTRKTPDNKSQDEHWGGVYDAPSEGDFVYNRKLFLNKMGIKNYIFLLRGVIEHENEKVYAIDFFTKGSMPGFDGTVFIETSSYAFVGITYYFNQLEREVTEKNIGYEDFFTIIQSNFQNINHKWYFKNFHGEQHAVKTKLFGSTYLRKAIIDFVTISIDTVDVTQIPEDDRVLRNAKVTDFKKYVVESEWQPIDSLMQKEEFKKYITNSLSLQAK